MTTVPEALRADVDLRGLDAVAAALDIHPTTVRRAMTGGAGQIAMRLIASFYGVPWDELPPPRKRRRRPRPSAPLPPISPELAASLAKHRAAAGLKTATVATTATVANRGAKPTDGATVSQVDTVAAPKAATVAAEATTGAVVELRSTPRPAGEDTTNRQPTLPVPTSITMMPVPRTVLKPVRLPLAPELVEGHRPPRLRSDCADGPRPCPWVRCGWHALWTRPKAERYGDPEEVAELVAGMTGSCVLDVADQDGATLGVVGEVMGITRERARQLEAKALAKLPRRVDDETFAEPEGFEGDW